MSHRKPPERRQNTITKDLTVIRGGADDVPAAPAVLPPALKARWYELWRSPLGGVWDAETDMPVLERLFSLYDLRNEAEAALREDGMIVKGSQGQVVDHPMTRRMKEYDAEIRQLEDRVGLNPKARLALGITGLQVKRGLKDLSETLDVNPDAADPRLGVVT